jgi:hypothetical protein
MKYNIGSDEYSVYRMDATWTESEETDKEIVYICS